MLQLDRRNFLQHVSRRASAPEQRPAFEVTDAATVEFLGLIASKLPRKICFSSGSSFCSPFSRNVEPVTPALPLPTWERRGPF